MIYYPPGARMPSYLQPLSFNGVPITFDDLSMPHRFLNETEMSRMQDVFKECLVEANLRWLDQQAIPAHAQNPAHGAKETKMATDASSTSAPKFSNRDYLMAAAFGLLLIQMLPKLREWITYARQTFPGAWGWFEGSYGYLIPCWLKEGETVDAKATRTAKTPAS